MADPNNLPPLPPGYSLDAAPAASPFGDKPVIVGPPPAPKEPKTTYRTLTPAEVTQHGLNPQHTYQMGSDGKVEKIDEAPNPADSHDAQKQQALEATHQLIQSIEKARGIVNDAQGPLGNTATGLGYNMLHNAPMATDAGALDATIQGEIQGNIFKNWMSSMKASTEKGGSAFGGRIMQSEIPFIVNSLGALKPGKLHTQQLLDNFSQVEDRVIRSAALLNDENPDDPKVLQKYHQMFMPAKSTADTTPPAPGSDTPNNPSAPGGSPKGGLDALNSQMRDMFQKGATTEQIVAFGRAHGVDPNPAEIDQARAKRMDIMFVQPSQQHGDQSPPPSGGGLGHDFMVGVGGVAQGVGDVLGSLSNPFISAVNAATGSNFRPDMGANVRDTLGLPAPQNNHEQFINTVNDYGTQGLGMAMAARSLASRIPGAVGNALDAFGSRPLTDAASGATGGGASDVTRQMGGGPLAQTAVGIAAGVPVASMGTRANALSRELPSVLNAAKQEGVTANRAMAFPSLEPKVVATGKTMTGAKIMGRDMRNIGGQIEGKVGALGQGGKSLEPTDAGNTVSGAGLRYITQTGAQFNRLYGSLGKATEGVKIPAKQATEQVDGLISQLSEMPNQNAKEISYLQGLKSDLSKPLTIDAMRGLRTKLRQDLMKGDLTFGPSEARVQGIADAASQDIANGLEAAGKGDVANRFKQVDGAYRERMGMVQNVVQKLIGKRGQNLSGEQVYANLKSMAGPRGNAAGLTRMFEQMTPSERTDIQATFADALGKNNHGDFSTAQLVSQAQKMPAAMRTAVFGPDGAASLDNLVTIAKEHARVSKALGGSPTALATDARSWITRLVLGGGSGAISAAEGGGLTHSAVAAAATTAGLTAAKAGSNALSARALMSPKITGWLRAAPRSSDPAAINAWYDRLKVIAVREPALAPEVKRLQDMIMSAANENVTKAAAASQTNQSN